MATAIDDQIIDDGEIIVGQDDNGKDLTVSILADRLTQIDVFNILEDAQHRDFSYIGTILETGTRGYVNQSPGELWSEWKEQKERWSFLTENLDLPLWNSSPK
jgi:hypothetical protein|tara:strand:+ start:497 stop:805 length:309 start_codon:yes stop_codon:yes gene_type:complete